MGCSSLREDVPVGDIRDRPCVLAVGGRPRREVAVVALAIERRRLLLRVLDRGLAAAAVRAFPSGERAGARQAAERRRVQLCGK